MGYRSSLEAANARIEALEHDNTALQAAVEAAHAHTTTDGATTPRERALTHELEEARRRVADLTRSRASTRAPVPWATITIAATASLLLLVAALAVARRSPASSARTLAAPATPPPPAAPARTASDEALVCDGPESSSFRADDHPGTMLGHDE